MLEGAAASPATSTLDEALALVSAPGDSLPIIGAFVDPQLEPRLQAARRGRRAGVATT